MFWYDNFPDTEWRAVNTYPRHFHNGSQDAVGAATFSLDLTEGFRDFLRFAAAKLRG
jgi:predicted 3-demethylubiquinone-9 3-methyltransferase (glyoxalase superfamily)